MKYTLEVEINAPRELVISRFQSLDDLTKWQPELLDAKPVHGIPGEDGSQTSLEYRFGKRKVEMMETVLKNNLPDSLEAYYEAPGAKNWVMNEFIVLSDERTVWRLKSEFVCTGFLRIIATLFPGTFRKSSLKSMHRFKEWVESTVKEDTLINI